MGRSTTLYVVLFSAAALFIGWHGCRAWIAHGGIASNLKTLSSNKAARSRNGLVAVAVAVVTLLVLFRIATHGR